MELCLTKHLHRSALDSLLSFAVRGSEVSTRNVLLATAIVDMAEAGAEPSETYSRTLFDGPLDVVREIEVFAISGLIDSNTTKRTLESQRPLTYSRLHLWSTQCCYPASIRVRCQTNIADFATEHS